MGQFDQWAEFIAKSVEAEATAAGNLIPHHGRVGSEREAIVRGVLARFLPRSYEVGTGHVVDAKDGVSKQIDLIIARSDYPVLRFNDGSANYLAEAVIATIEVKSRLTKPDLHAALDNCKSVVEFNFDLDSVPGLERAFGVKHMDGNLTGDGIAVERALAATRPNIYIFSYAESTDLKGHLQEWIDALGSFHLHDLPAFIGARQQFAWRNDDAQGWTDGRTPGLLLGREGVSALRLFVLHLLRTVHRAAPRLPDNHGLARSAHPHHQGKFEVSDALVELRR